MVGGGVVMVAALAWLAFGRGSSNGDSAAALAARCSFPACRAAKDPGLARGYEGEGYARPQLGVPSTATGSDRLLLSFWVCRVSTGACPEARFSHSDDGGTTFSTPVRINDQSVGINRTPSAAVQAPDGTLFITL